MKSPLALDCDLIRVDCPACGKKYGAKQQVAGRQFQCRNKECAEILTVPWQDQPEDNPEPASPQKRRVWPWAIVLAVTIIINVASLHVSLSTEANEQPPSPVVVAAAQSQPEGENPPAAAAALPVVASAPKAASPPSPPVAIPAAKPKPRSLIERASDGDVSAMGQLGLCYEQGTGVPQSLEEAAAWYEEAAEAGNAAAMYKIGLCYALGKGVDKDEEIAKDWLNESAKAGHADASWALGLVTAGIPPVLAAAWMSRPIGERPKPEAIDATEDSSPGLSATERTQLLISRWSGLMGRGSLSAGQRQRQNFVRWTLRGGLPNQIGRR